MLTSLKRNRWVHLYNIYTRYVSKINHNYVLSPDTEFGVSKICMSESTCVVFSKNLDAQVHYRPKDSEPLLGIYTQRKNLKQFSSGYINLSLENHGKHYTYLGHKQDYIIDFTRKLHDDKLRPSLTELPQNMNDIWLLEISVSDFIVITLNYNAALTPPDCIHFFSSKNLDLIYALTRLLQKWVIDFMGFSLYWLCKHTGFQSKGIQWIRLLLKNIYSLFPFSQCIEVVYFTTKPPTPHFWSEACRILVPQAGIEPKLPTVEAWSLNHWTTREVSLLSISCQTWQCDLLWFLGGCMT